MPRGQSGLKMYGAAAIAAAVGVAIVVMAVGGVGSNDTQNWQIRQGFFGKVDVHDGAGYYLRNFASIWTFPRAVSAEFKQAGKGEAVSRAERAEDQSIRVTFNDGGTAQMGTTIRFATPTTEEKRLKLHKDSSGEIQNVRAWVKSHLVNCMKASGPLMSSSEHMSARKAEFTQLVHAQMIDGLYRMRRYEHRIKSEDESGDEIVVWATEIVTDAETGKPIIEQRSPLANYDLEVLQFSIEDTDYDGATLI